MALGRKPGGNEVPVGRLDNLIGALHPGQPVLDLFLEAVHLQDDLNPELIQAARGLVRDRTAIGEHFDGKPFTPDEFQKAHDVGMDHGLAAQHNDLAGAQGLGLHNHALDFIHRELTFRGPALPHIAILAPEIALQAQLDFHREQPPIRGGSFDVGLRKFRPDHEVMATHNVFLRSHTRTGFLDSGE